MSLTTIPEEQGVTTSQTHRDRVESCGTKVPITATRVRAYYDKAARTYEHAHYGGGSTAYPANRIRLKKALGMLVKEQESLGRPLRVLDVGCGTGILVRGARLQGMDATGFDFSTEMVTEAKGSLMPDTEVVWQGDAEDPAAYPLDRQGQGNQDAVVCLGVVPHNSKLGTLLGNFARVLRPGGLLLVEHRNRLFSLITANQYSVDFMFDLLNRTHVLTRDPRPDREQALRGASEAFYAGMFGAEGRDSFEKSGYGDITRFDNPLELQGRYEYHGFRWEQPIWYHFHAGPPAVEHVDPEMYRELSLAMEDRYDRDWPGMFLASAFVAVARKGR